MVTRGLRLGLVRGRALGKSRGKEGPRATAVRFHRLPVGAVVAPHPGHGLVIMAPVPCVDRMKRPRLGGFPGRHLQNKGTWKPDAARSFLKRTLKS